MATIQKKTTGPSGSGVVPFLPTALERGYEIRIGRLFGQGARHISHNCDMLEKVLFLSITALREVDSSLADSQRIVDGVRIQGMWTQEVLERGDLEEMIAARDALRLALYGEGGAEVVDAERQRLSVSASDATEGM